MIARHLERIHLASLVVGVGRVPANLHRRGKDRTHPVVDQPSGARFLLDGVRDDRTAFGDVKCIVVTVESRFRGTVDAQSRDHKAMAVKSERDRRIGGDDRTGDIIGRDELLFANVDIADAVRADHLVGSPQHGGRYWVRVLLIANNHCAIGDSCVRVELPAAKVVSEPASRMLRQPEPAAAQVVVKGVSQPDRLVLMMPPAVVSSTDIVREIAGQECMFSPLDLLGEHGAVIGVRRTFVIGSPCRQRRQTGGEHGHKRNMNCRKALVDHAVSSMLADDVFPRHRNNAPSRHAKFGIPSE